MSTVLTGTAYHSELIDGREVEKPLPKLLHARIQSLSNPHIGFDAFEAD